MPVEQPPLVPGAGPRPFRTRDDVVAQLDDILAGDGVTLAPIRDALIDALTALLFELQFRGEYAIAQCDLLRCTERYLTALGGDDRRVPRAPGESDIDYRRRLLSVPANVTEVAILAGVNIILAAFTSTPARLIDAALDRWFVGTDDPRSWHSFIGNSPEYPDRLYSGQEAINGASRPNSDPGGARLFADSLGRQFLLLLPDFLPLTLPAPIAIDSTTGDTGYFEHTIAGHGFYVSPPDPQVGAFVGFSSSLAIYQAIEGFVNSVAGQSIRWGFIAELEAA